MNLRPVLAFVLLLPLPAMAQTGPDAVPPGPAREYWVEPSRTQVLFLISELGLMTFSGEFSGAGGHLVLDPSDPNRSRLDITLPMSRLTTSSTAVTAALKGSFWLDTDKFPTAVFHSSHVVVTGPETADVDGMLTLHGVTHPLLLKAQFVGDRPIDNDLPDSLGFTVSGSLSLSDYEVTSLLSMVGNDVQLNIRAGFEKK